MEEIFVADKKSKVKQTDRYQLNVANLIYESNRPLIYSSIWSASKFTARHPNAILFALYRSYCWHWNRELFESFYCFCVLL